MKVRTSVDYIELVLAFVLSFLGAALYYITLTKVLSGAWVAYTKLSDVPDMITFAIVSTIVWGIVRFGRNGAGDRLLLIGFTLEVFIMVIVLTAIRLLAIYPAGGGAGALFLIVTFVAVPVLILITRGYVQSVSGHRYTPSAL